MLKPRLLVCSWIGLVDWIGYDMSQLKLIEYQTMHHVSHPSMCMDYLCKGNQDFQFVHRLVTV